jgi:hypothetical protein
MRSTDHIDFSTILKEAKDVRRPDVCKECYSSIIGLIKEEEEGYKMKLKIKE